MALPTHEMNEHVFAEVEALLAERYSAASVQEILSERGNKRLAIMTEPDGQMFVARQYDPGEAEGFAEEIGVPHFADALTAMQGMYRKAGIAVVHSSVLPASTSELVTVVSNYVPGIVSFRDHQAVPSTVKESAFRRLGQLLDTSIEYLPGAEARVSDLFVADTASDGTMYPLVVDVDPHLIKKERGGGRMGSLMRDMQVASFMQSSKNMMDLVATNDDEAAAMAHAFIAGLTAVGGDEVIDYGTRTLDAFSDMHFASQGIRYR
jgi:hypothetical protein